MEEEYTTASENSTTSYNDSQDNQTINKIHVIMLIAIPIISRIIGRFTAKSLLKSLLRHS